MTQQYRGASMGRPDRPLAWGDRLRLSVLKIDSQGYDPGGAYWGISLLPLYQARDERAGVIYLRAPDRAAAKSQLELMAGGYLRFWK